MTVLKVENLSKTYTSGIIYRTITEAVKSVNFELTKGQVVSLVGESGSGKSTIAKILLKLENETEGNIFLDNVNIHEYKSKEYYRKIQIIFQDPYSAINYFYRIDRVLHQAIDLLEEHYTQEERAVMIKEVLKKVGINSTEILGRYPHQLSGGQLQRFLIARVLLIKPDIVIADEITSMIDASSRAGILNLLLDLRDKEGLTVIFITHDIGQAQYISDDIFVLKEGVLVEAGDAHKVLTDPQHDYTKHLLSCVPSLHRVWELEE